MCSLIFNGLLISISYNKKSLYCIKLFQVLYSEENCLKSIFFYLKPESFSFNQGAFRLTKEFLV